jgi:hypothetical protein
MIREILKNPMFNIVFSFVLGVGIIAICRPLCKPGMTGKDGECATAKAPPVNEWEGAVYRIGSKCYEYKTNTIDCPADKADFIESFKSEFSERNSQLKE